MNRKNRHSVASVIKEERLRNHYYRVDLENSCEQDTAYFYLNSEEYYIKRMSFRIDEVKSYHLPKKIKKILYDL